MTSKEALGYLDDIAHGRKMEYDPHELKNIVEKDLEALEIIKKYICIKDNKTHAKEWEWDLLKEALK